MNILWVEDNPNNKKEFWFGERIVSIVTDFTKAEETIKNSLNKYDLAVLDIDLSNSDKEKVEERSQKNGLTPDEFLQKGGMTLFLTLLESGFPREQIIFVTGNSDINNLSKFVDKIESSEDQQEIKNATKNVLLCLSEEQIAQLKQKNDKQARIKYLRSLVEDNTTYGIFKKSCKDICIEAPKAISKSNDNDARRVLNEWLEGHEKNDYLVLRRGIIEGCNFLKKLIQDDENNIRFSDFVKRTKNSPVISIYPDDLLNYLDIIENFLPVRQPTVLNDIYRLFLRTLTHEWDNSINPQDTTENYGGDIHTFAWLSKMTRNWLSHAKLLEELNSELIAFIFTVNMRAMFKLPAEQLDYERFLLKCISKSPIPINNSNLNKRIEDFESKVDGILFNLPEPFTDENNPKINLKYFGEKINYIYRNNTGKQKEHDYHSFLFQYFWVNQKKTIINLTGDSDGFLPTLARHIYIRTFQ